MLAFVTALCGCSSFDAAGDGAHDGGADSSGPLTGIAVNPKLDITKVEDAVLVQGGVVTFKVTFTRHDVDGSVTVKTSDLPAGITAPDVVVPPGATEASVQLTASGAAAQGKNSFSVTASSVIVGQQPAVGTAKAALLVRGGKGTIDTTFGQVGKVSALLGSGLDATGIELALYRDDRVGVIVQRESTATGYVVRTTRDGVLDPAFGSSGTQQLAQTPSAVGTDSSDAIFVAGAAANLRTLVKLTSAGKLDTSFGQSSVYNLGLNLAYYPFQPYTILAKPDGIDVWGDSSDDTGSGSHWHPFLHKVVLQGQSSSRTWYGFETLLDNYTLGITTRPDGKTLHARLGRFSDLTTKYNGIALVLVNADGTQDPTFAGGDSYGSFHGVTVVRNADVRNSPRPTGIALAPDMTISVPFVTPAGVSLVRFQANGLWDTTFGTGGFRASIITGGTLGQAVSLGADGFLLALYGLHEIRLAKFDYQGSPDGNFGFNGVATYSFGPDVDTQGARVAVQSDGRVVVLTTAVGTSKDAVLLRFWN